MKLIKCCSVLMTVGLLLSGCMTPEQRNEQSYAVAKQNFAEQNFRTAFLRVQRPAKAGNADAQYALGYMYYYGKGTVINRPYAVYWFQQAAAQGQKDAQRALKMVPQKMS